MHSAWTSELITSGGNPAASIASTVAIGERAHAMADIERHSPLARRHHGRPDAPIGQHRGVRRRPEAMGQHVPWPQAGQHRVEPRHRPVDMAHHRQTGEFGRLQREMQRLDAVRAAGAGADADLDAAHEIAVLPGDPRADHRIQQPQVP